MERFKLTGGIECYRATGDADCKKKIEQSMDCLVNEDGSLSSMVPSQDWMALVYWFDETGKEKYEKALLRLAEGADMSISAMPFFTAYDTRYCKKEHYSSIVASFYGLAELAPDDFVALADTIGQMSEEIFEHYKALIELLRKNVRSCMAKDTGDMIGQMKTGYAALKGYNLGILQNEAYSEFGTKIWKSTAECGDDRAAGMKEKLRGQYLLLRK